MDRTKKLKIKIVAVVLLFSPVSVWAELSPQQEVAAKLGKIRSDVNRKSTQIEKLEKKQDTARTALESQTVQLRSYREEETALADEVDQVREQLTNARAELTRLAIAIDRIQELTAKRVRALYTHRWDGVLEKMLQVDRSAGFARTSYLVSRLRAYDENLLNEHAALQESFTRERLRLEELEKRRARLFEEAVRKREQTQRAVAENERLLKQYTKHKEKLEKLLLELQAQALRLETIVASITNGGMDLVDRGRPRQENQSSRLSSRRTVSAPFQGRGLVRGALALPVDGKVVRGFGKRRHSQFSDYVFQKGIEFTTGPGADVVAVQAGKVLYKGRMPAFGTILIVDHGKRLYSLYGRVSDTRASVGDTVEKGEVIAAAGGENSGGKDGSGNFYFEIRKAGSPVNPQKYYRKRFVR